MYSCFGVFFIVFLTAELFTDLWNARRNDAKQEAEAIRRNLIQIERKIEQFLDRIAEADNSILITAYEKKIRQLEEEEIELDEKNRKMRSSATIVR